MLMSGFDTRTYSCFCIGLGGGRAPVAGRVGGGVFAQYVVRSGHTPMMRRHSATIMRITVPETIPIPI